MTGEEVKIRLSTEADMTKLTEWLRDPDILNWFPMIHEWEILDATRIWTLFVNQGGGLTAEYQGEPIGVAVLNFQHYEKFKHQCLISIIVSSGHRGKGVGTKLLTELESLAKSKGIHMLHLEVYDENPAFRLYERMGYKTFGKHAHFTKEMGVYRAKIMMDKWLVQDGRTQ